MFVELVGFCVCFFIFVCLFVCLLSVCSARGLLGLFSWLFKMTYGAETAEGAKINKLRFLLSLSMLPRHKIFQKQSCQFSTPLETGFEQEVGEAS